MSCSNRHGSRRAPATSRMGSQLERSVFQFLIRCGSDELRRKAVYSAAKYGDVRSLRFLLDSGVSVVGDLHPLELAVARGHTEVVSVLLKHGCYRPDVSTIREDEGNTSDDDDRPEDGLSELRLGVRDHALDLAIWRCDLPVVQALIKAGMDWRPRNKYDEAALFVAACGDSATVAEFLIDNLKCELDEMSLGNTPLHIATQRSHLATQCVLLRHGADVNIHSHSDHVPPLRFAIATGNIHSVQNLLTAGCMLDLNSLRLHSDVQNILIKHPDIEELLSSFKEQPRCLKELCRHRIRMCLSPPRLVVKVGELSLPAALVRYVSMEAEMNIRHFCPEVSKRARRMFLPHRNALQHPRGPSH